MILRPGVKIYKEVWLDKAFQRGVYLKKSKKDGGKMKKTPLDRREFCKSVAKRAAAFLAVTAGAAALSYKKPSIRSFIGGKKAYAQQTGAGKFTLRGGTAAPTASRRRR